MSIIYHFDTALHASTYTCYNHFPIKYKNDKYQQQEMCKHCYVVFFYHDLILINFNTSISGDGFTKARIFHLMGDGFTKARIFHLMGDGFTKARIFHLMEDGFTKARIFHLMGDGFTIASIFMLMRSYFQTFFLSISHYIKKFLVSSNFT